MLSNEINRVDVSRLKQKFKYLNNLLQQRKS